MKITNFELIQIANILEEYANKKFPQKINFAILKNMINLQNEINIYQKALQDLLNKYDHYIIKDSEGNNKTNKSGIPEVEESHRKDFDNELMELLQMVIEIELYQIEEDSFNYEDNDRYDTLSAQDILKLQQILCKREESKED